RDLPVDRRDPARGDLVPALSVLGGPAQAPPLRRPGKLLLPPGARRLQGEGLLGLPAPQAPVGPDGPRRLQAPAPAGDVDRPWTLTRNSVRRSSGRTARPSLLETHRVRCVLQW